MVGRAVEFTSGYLAVIVFIEMTDELIIAAVSGIIINLRAFFVDFYVAASNKSNKVVYSDNVALGTTPLGILTCASAFRVASLGSGAVNIH